MAVASINLPQKLGVELREKAEEAGYLPDEFGVELIRRRGIWCKRQRSSGALHL